VGCTSEYTGECAVGSAREDAYGSLDIGGVWRESGEGVDGLKILAENGDGSDFSCQPCCRLVQIDA